MTLSFTPPSETPGTRPRVEGDREQQILDATCDVLAEVGYDRLTMDAVAASARASKATLYRRWSTKADLVIDAVCSMKGDHEIPDTGTLRGDLLGAFCGHGEGSDDHDNGLATERTMTILASVITAIARDRAFAQLFRDQFIGPKAVITETIFKRALDRGEIRPDLDLDLIAPALPGIVMHRALVLGQLPDVDYITRVVDEIILPAVGAGQSHSAPNHTTPDTKDFS